MEKFAYTMKTLFQKKLNLYETLKKVLEQEKKELKDMDVDSLWRAADRKKELAGEIEDVREEILEFMRQKGLSMEQDEKGFSLSRVISSLSLSGKETLDLKMMQTKIDIAKKELSVMAMENKRYTTDFLQVIRDIFSTITSSKNREQYTHKGVVLDNLTKKHLIRAEV